MTRSDARFAVLVLTCALAIAAPARAADESPGLDLEGTWHVLVHYTDSDAADTEVKRWDDRLWVFERKGSRLSWTEYPIVVFGDRSGRFETSAHGQRRVLHAWEPNPIQQAQIEQGLEFNSRGSKTKSLRRKRDGTWQSTGSAATLSASTIGYQEIWTITALDEVPTFTRDDVLGSSRAESMSGRTQYTGKEIARGGALIRGDFARDESRRGTFRMLRAGSAESVGTKRTQQQRMLDGLDPSAFGLDEDEAEDAEADE